MASIPRMLSAVALAVLTGLAAGCSNAAPTATGSATTESVPTAVHLPAEPGRAPQTLSETGSTLLYPLLKTWAAAYHQKFGQVTIPTAGTGSSAGIKAAATGTATIGASDAYLSSGTLVANPTLLNIPLAISAQQVNYNVPGIRPGQHLKLTGAVLAQMYQGSIKTWNAPPIQSLNPGVHLPGTRIVPLHRAQGSGDTFLFSSYLATGDANWNTVIGYGTTVAWPAIPTAQAVQGGNSGMISACHATPGCVAYIGIAYLTQARDAGLGYAALANASGQFEVPTATAISAAAASFVSLLPPNETISLINGPAPGGYPIVNYEYAIVSSRQPTAAKAHDLQAFLHWAITAGSAASFLGPVQFQPLPAAAAALADVQIASIR